jgi:cyclopropane fatty-acyl-phospholipid synthase-like methyltransferase
MNITKLYDLFIDYSDNDDMLDSKKVGWTTKEEQEVRFKALLAIGVKSGDKLLDYGCGLGHLVDYMSKVKLDVDYTGIDINENYIDIASRIFINSNFRIGDIEGETTNYDWIVASGVFTYGITKEEIFSKIDKCMSLIKKGFSFNFLLPTENFIAWGFNTFNPLEILSDLKQLYPYVYLIQGYAEDDFTIFITKDPLQYDIK